jgi:hypothetical protein
MYREETVKRAHDAAHCDERVSRALEEENGYWQSDEVRLRVIQSRGLRAQPRKENT